MKKALAWSSIKPEDVNALHAYSLLLCACCNVMEKLQHMQELDMPSNMRTIMSKLPFKLREQWRTVAHDILETSKHRALFKDLVAFIEKHVRILSDPLFGDIDAPSGTTFSKAVNRFKPQPGNRMKGKSFATTTAPVQSVQTSEDTKVVLPAHSSTVKSTCICCAQHHSLGECQQFQRKKHRDQIHFLKEKAICFGCLFAGHRSCDCDKHLTCRVCGQNHSTVLHVDKRGTARTGSYWTTSVAW